MRQVTHVAKLLQIEVGDRANAMAALRKLLEQQGLGHIMFSKQALLALGLHWCECAVAGFPNAQGRHRNARGFGYRTNAVQRGGGGCSGIQNLSFE